MEPLSLETSRLNIRWLSFDDAEFIFTLVNDPDWIRFIGDKGVNSLDAARNYLETGPLQMYRQHGFGLNRVALKDSDEPIGICGILKRDTLDDVDLGFAFLPEFRRHGYALGASRAVLEYGFRTLDLKRIVAIVSPQNTASAKLLYKLGFRLEADYQSQADTKPLDLYFIDE